MREAYLYYVMIDSRNVAKSSSIISTATIGHEIPMKSDDETTYSAN